MLISEDLADLVEEIYIDSEGNHSMTKVTKTKVVKSDHNTIVTKINMTWNSHIKHQKTNIFNLKNKDCLKKFKETTSNNNYLSKIFDEEDDINHATKTLMKKLDKVLHRCLKKWESKKILLKPNRKNYTIIGRK